MRTFWYLLTTMVGKSPLFRKLLKLSRDHTLTRREFLTKTGTAALVSQIPFFFSNSRANAHFTNEPVVILGAGAAGLTAAYQLSKKGILAHVYEASTRAGGRIYTKDGFTREGMFCELGGELVDSNHTELIALCAELGVGLQELREGETGEEIFFINGKKITEEEIKLKWKALADFILRARNESFDESGAALEAARKWDALTLKEYLELAKKEVDADLIELVRVAYVGEYGLEVEEQSALNLISLIGVDAARPEMFGSSDETKRIKGGNSRLIDALKARVVASSPIRYRHQLISIRESKSRNELILVFQCGNKTVTKRARHVISAVPFTVFRQIEGVSQLDFSPSKAHVISALGYGTNSKLMQAFDARVWRDPSLNQGKAIYNGATFSSRSYQSSWETSRMQPFQAGILTNFCGGKQGEAHSIAGGDAERFIDGLSDVFTGIREAARSNERILMNWKKYPYNQGSYSCYKPGQFLDFSEIAGTSELGGKLLFAGEHTSLVSSGFMNGAVDSGNRVATQVVQILEKGIANEKPSSFYFRPHL